MQPSAPSSPPASAHADVRHVTIVRCDLVGSTRIKKALDLDGQLAFKDAWERTVTDLTTRHAAHLETFEGDGALIVLGHPNPREDMAEAALRLGLDLVDAVRRIQVGTTAGMEVRVGIATGPVVTVTQPLRDKSETIAGITIDIAERLRALANPGQVVAADSTRRLAGRFFEYADLGVVPMKGFEEGARAWRVEGASSVASRFEAQREMPDQSEIVGRAAELAVLARAWESARTTAGTTVRLIGDAGLGKSRLAREALRRAAGDDATVLQIDCTPATRNSPFYPIAVLLRRLANIGPHAMDEENLPAARALLGRALDASRIDDALPYVAPLFGIDGLRAPADVAPLEVRERTVEILVTMMKGIAAQGPTVLLCEDAHWVDDTTATVLQRIGAGIADMRALLLITTRPGPDAAATEIPGASNVELTPLDEASAERLVRSIAPRGVSDVDIEQIVQRCEGVPLVLEEVARSAADPATAGDAVATGYATAAPGPLELVVQSRLGRLESIVPLAQAAAVLGREFSLRVLAQINKEPSDGALVGAVNAMAREGLVERAVAGIDERARFKHVMIREAVYNTLLGKERQRLHSLAADTLRTGYAGTPDATPDVLAEHLRRATRFAESIRVRLDASADTASRGAYVETEGHCRAGLATVESVEDGDERRELRFRLLVQLGVALAGRHGYSSAKVEETYREAQAACGDSAGAQMLYPIMRGLTAFNLVRGNLAAGHELSLQALAVANQSRRPEFRIDAMSVHGYALLYHGRLDECRAWIEHCLSLYYKHDGRRFSYPVPNDAGTAAHALLPTVEWLLGDAAAAERAIARGLAHAETLDRDFDRAMIHAWTAGVRYTQRRCTDCLQHAGRAVEIAQRCGFKEWLGVGSLLALLAQSQLAPNLQALQQAGDICAMFASEGVGLNASYYLWGLARGYQKLGDVGTATYLLGEAVKRARDSDETRMDAELLMLQASLHPDQGESQAILQQAIDVASGQGNVANALRAAATLVQQRSQDPLATDTLALLEGAREYPAEPRWMQARLDALLAKNPGARRAATMGDTR